jgi:hypothetical protein
MAPAASIPVIRLRFAVKKSLESVDTFRTRINAAAVAEEEDLERSTPGPTIGFWALDSGTSDRFIRTTGEGPQPSLPGGQPSQSIRSAGGGKRIRHTSDTTGPFGTRSLSPSGPSTGPSTSIRR